MTLSRYFALHEVEGWHLKLFAAEGYEVTGVGISPSVIALVRQRAAERCTTRTHFRVEDATTLTSFADASFDLVLSVHLIDQVFS